MHQQNQYFQYNTAILRTIINTVIGKKAENSHFFFIIKNPTCLHHQSSRNIYNTKLHSSFKFVLNENDEEIKSRKETFSQSAYHRPID